MKALPLLLILCLPVAGMAQKDTVPGTRDYRVILQNDPAQER
jgi:hypothetical protein